MLYLILAHDGTDPEAPQRRQAVRDQHLAAARQASEAGALKLGGAILDASGAMIGSALIVEAASEEEARAFVAQDIYTRAGVWQRFEVYPFKPALGLEP